MIQVQLKLRIKPKKEITLNQWLLVLTRFSNWAIRKIEFDAKDRIYDSKKDFQDLRKKLEIPSDPIKGMLIVAWESWNRYFKKLSKKPRLKGIRNRLNSIPFPDSTFHSDGLAIKIPGFGILSFQKEDVREEKMKSGRIVRRVSGWYLSLFIEAVSKTIPLRTNHVVGVDPGEKSTLILSSGFKNDKPKQLTERLEEQVENRRKDDNHQLSRKLVAENALLVFKKDNIKGIAKSYGKSVAEACHHRLRRMLCYKCTASGRKYIEVDSKGSTMTCSSCLPKMGPTGKAGLSVRQWGCAECGILQGRDQNAAINTLLVGLGTSLERCA